MFPTETHVRILKKLDSMEAETYRLYRAMQNMRLELQEQWKALPSGEYWTKERHDETAYSAK